MKCSNCGYENKDKAKFCTKCGSSLVVKPESNGAQPKSGNSKGVIIALIAVIVILIAVIGFFALNNSGSIQSNDNSQSDSSQNQDVDNSDDKSNDNSKTESVSSSESSSSSGSSSSKTTESKSWESIGSYSGSGSGSKTINVPEGKIMVKLSAYPIKNYATNHLYVSGSNGESGGVDWGSTSAVETRSDSFTYTSSSEEVFTIDYYETVSWEVEFFRYQ